MKPRVLLVGGPDVDARLPLMRHLRADFDVAAVGSDPALKARFDAEHFDYYSYALARGTNPARDIAAIWQLATLFRRLTPRVVHAFDTKPGVYAALAARGAGVPVIIGTVTGLGYLYAADGPAVRALRLIYQQFQRAACAASSLTIFQNTGDYHQLIAAGIVAEHKAQVIPGSGVVTGEFSQAAIPDGTKADLHAELGLEPGVPVVTMISRVIRSKGVLDFAAVAREAARRGQRARFLLVGPDDTESADRLNAAERADLLDTVTWIGPRRDIPAILAVSDVFVLPTAYREGIPRVLLESAAMGLPLVTTDSPGCNDVVEDGVNGFLVTPGDKAKLAEAIVKLIEQPDLRARFGAVSRRRAVERFDLAVIAQQTRDAYLRLLTAGRSTLTAAPAQKSA